MLALHNAEGEPDKVTDFGVALTLAIAQRRGSRILEFLREDVRVLAQGLMELKVTETIRAGRYERSDERTTFRNG